MGEGKRTSNCEDCFVHTPTLCDSCGCGVLVNEERQMHSVRYLRIFNLMLDNATIRARKCLNSKGLPTVAELAESTSQEASEAEGSLD